MLKPPAKQDYNLPAEWTPHAGTQLHWPANRQTWPGERLQQVEKVFLNIIEILCQYEQVHLFINDEKTKNYVLDLFDSQGIHLQSITFHLQPTNDVWARDCGPMFITRKKNEYAIVDWDFNAWGEKYPPFAADNRLPQFVAQKYGIKCFKPGMVLEGGAIETNGDGVLLATESVLLNENRNPDLTKQEIEQRLKDYLGIERIIWLKRGLAGDDTDGHIDDLARFVNGNTIVAMVCDDPGNVNYQALQQNLHILQKATDQHGHPLKIETLPMPETKVEGATVDGSKHVPASYANFYVANGVVLVPLYDERYDEQALALFETHFPERDIHGVPCADLVWGQGGIHCITREWYGM